MKLYKDVKELGEAWGDSKDLTDFNTKLDSQFHNRLFEALDDDALLILTTIKEEQIRELRDYFVRKLNGGF